MDFFTLKGKSTVGRLATCYIIPLDIAKHLAVMFGSKYIFFLLISSITTVIT